MQVATEPLQSPAAMSYALAPTKDRASRWRSTGTCLGRHPHNGVEHPVEPPQVIHSAEGSHFVHDDIWPDSDASTLAEVRVRPTAEWSPLPTVT
jgi:hypothetical protein